MRFIKYFTLLLFMAGCTAAPKYALSPPDPIEPKIKIAIQWVAQAGEKHFRQQSQLPVKIAGDNIYLANADGNVGAMDLRSGKVLWQIALKERITAGPGYGDGVVVIGNNDAEVVALEDNSGRELWRQKVSSEILAEPVIFKDKVFVQTIDGKIFALNLSSGKKLWVESREIPALTLRGTAKPLIVKDKLLVGFASGELVAFNTTSGKVEWELAVAVPRGRTDLERIVDIDGLFYVNEDVIYVVSYQGRMAAVDLKEGRINWSREMSSYSGVSVDDKQIYVTDEAGFIWALDKNSGATLWRQDKLAERYPTAPAILQNWVVVADAGGYIYWLSKEDGDIVAQKDMYKINVAAFVHWSDEILEDKDYGVSTYMIVAENHLLVRNNEGSLALFTVIQ